LKEWTIEREEEQMTGLSKVAAATKERNERMSLLWERVGATRARLWWWARDDKERE
jgi:hypothetical protein